MPQTTSGGAQRPIDTEWNDFMRSLTLERFAPRHTPSRAAHEPATAGQSAPVTGAKHAETASAAARSANSPRRTR